MIIKTVKTGIPMDIIRIQSKRRRRRSKEKTGK